MRNSQSLPAQLPCRAGPATHVGAVVVAGVLLILPSLPPMASAEDVEEETVLLVEIPEAVVAAAVSSAITHARDH